MSKSSRRDFVTGRSIIHGVRARVGPTTTRTSLVHYTRRAMGCGFSLFIPTQERHDPGLPLLALDLVEEFERLLSIYRDDSQISTVNRLAADEPVPVDPRVMAVLRLAKQLWSETGGAFDVTAGRLVDLWGFSLRNPARPDRQVLEDCVSHLGCDKLLLDAEDGSVRFGCEGPKLDLGGIGKGFALDECQRLLDSRGLGHYMLHGGLSSVLGRGQHDAAESPWTVDLRLPIPDKPLVARLPIRDAALATSGDAVQYFEVDGVRYGHILDPRSGQPARELLMASVYASSAAEADALSTAFCVLGLDAARQYCQVRPGISAILVTRDASYATVHRIGTLPDDIVWGESRLLLPRN